MTQMKHYIPVLLSPYLLLITEAALLNSVKGSLGLVPVLLVYDIIALITECRTLKKTPEEDLYQAIRYLKLFQIPAYLIVFVLCIILIVKTIYSAGTAVMILPFVFLFIMGPFGLILLPLICMFAGAVFLPVIGLIILEAFGLVLSAIPEISSFHALYHHRRMAKAPYIILSILQFIYCLDVIAAGIAHRFIVY